MKLFLFITALLTVVNTDLFSQNKPYNVVFDITTEDSATHQRVIRWIKGIIESHPDAKIEVVFYGKSLPMVESKKSTVSGDVKKLAAGTNVKFAVCEQAMQIHKVDKSMLLQGVGTVHDAIYELITRQAEGYGYIKVVN